MEEQNSQQNMSEVELKVDNFDAVPAERLEDGSVKRISAQGSVIPTSSVHGSGTVIDRNSIHEITVKRISGQSSVVPISSVHASVHASSAGIEQNTIPVSIKSSMLAAKPSLAASNASKSGHKTIIKAEKLEQLETKKSVSQPSKAAAPVSLPEKIPRPSRICEPQCVAVPIEKVRPVKQCEAPTNCRPVPCANVAPKRPAPRSPRPQSSCAPVSYCQDSRSGGQGDCNVSTPPCRDAGPSSACNDYCSSDEPDESPLERLVGLSEMFPESFRNTVARSVCYATSGIKTVYGFACNASWVAFTSFSILILPIIIEAQRTRFNESIICNHRKCNESE